ncbi:TPA: hypothetical protein ACJEU7_003053 [Acinetobacter baumannii]|uniref:hypothetical protein n=1 Tax=Acinetobacter baumannii TaxID=470 RepID=UPI001249D341|nr:hypothetical protein [Acinetobacter baumannii]KAB1665034.1 hypothetical protein F8B05_19485 [Acinetobacter baumannii]MCX3034125.1 hypothetical protein [Acinetobacter baumannii]
MADDAMERCYCCGKKLNMNNCVSGEVFQYPNETGELSLYVVFDGEETPDFLSEDLSLSSFNFGKTCAKNIKKADHHFNENWM